MEDTCRDGTSPRRVDGTKEHKTVLERAVSHAKEFIEASPEDHKK